MAKKEEETPSLLTGTLPNIKETGEPLTDVQNRINVDEASYHPDKLITFQKVMSGTMRHFFHFWENTLWQPEG